MFDDGHHGSVVVGSQAYHVVGAAPGQALSGIHRGSDVRHMEGGAVRLGDSRRGLVHVPEQGEDPSLHVLAH